MKRDKYFCYLIVHCEMDKIERNYFKDGLENLGTFHLSKKLSPTNQQ